MAALINKRVLALGFFDSVHIGHRFLLNKAAAIAKEFGAELQVLTFNDDFFANLGRKDKEVYLLEERMCLLGSLGFDNITVLEPTKEFLAQSPEQFLGFLLKMKPAAIVAGKDYTYGYLGKGNMKSLYAYMSQMGIEVFEVDLQEYMKEKISSTKIKELLDKGDIKGANLLLGDSFFVTGKVQKGRGVGKTIGIPTANISVPNLKQLPREGVYKTRTLADGMVYSSITNVGSHPTFEDRNFNIETLLLGFDGNLYNKEIKVYFESRIRDTRKFAGAKELAEQINSDIAYAFNQENKHCSDSLEEI